MTTGKSLQVLREIGIREGLIATGVTQEDTANDSGRSQTPTGMTRQTTLHMWYTTPTLNIKHIKDSTKLLDLEDRNITQEEKISQIL